MRILLLFFLVMPTMASSEILNSLDALEWQNRIILVKTDRQADTVRALRAQHEAIEERHIAWFVLYQRRLVTNLEVSVSPELVTTLNEDRFTGAANEVILIGKDGGVKHRDDKLDLGYIYQLIDSMPMRQQEMQSDDY